MANTGTQKIKKLYVGCAINNLSPENKVRFLKQIADLKDSLRDHFEVLDFVGDAAAPVEVIYTHDIHNCVGQADCMLAICDHPSTGLGYELGTALEKHDIPVLAVAHTDSSVTRLVQGITGKKFKFVRYEDFGEIKKMAIEVLG
ncbi:MAG: hypothetical protein KBC33_03940 [Candidatus Pacebacteria bacterium]|nr:hypothetical protein [Candidatus Paceibacterota bacterium]